MMSRETATCRLSQSAFRADDKPIPFIISHSAFGLRRLEAELRHALIMNAADDTRHHVAFYELGIPGDARQGSGERALKFCRQQIQINEQFLIATLAIQR